MTSLEQYITDRIASLETATHQARETAAAWNTKVQEVQGALSEMRLLKARLTITEDPTPPDKEI